MPFSRISRRDFIKKGALATAGVGLLPTFSFATEDNVYDYIVVGSGAGIAEKASETILRQAQ